MKLLLTEDQYSRLFHFMDRAENRIGQGQLSLPKQERHSLENALDSLYGIRFPKDKKIAYRFFVFRPLPQRPHYFEQEKPYYRFRDKSGNLFVGDEAWVIADKGNLVTILVRKSEETKSRARAKRMFQADAVAYTPRELRSLQPDKVVQY